MAASGTRGGHTPPGGEPVGVAPVPQGRPATGTRGEGTAGEGTAGEGTAGESTAGEGIDEIGIVLGPDEAIGGLFERTGTDTNGPDRTGTVSTVAPEAQADRTSANVSAPHPRAPSRGEGTGEDATSSDVEGPETTSGRPLPPGTPSGSASRAPSPLARSTPRRRTALLAWIAADLPVAGEKPRPAASEVGPATSSAALPQDGSEATRRRDGVATLSAVAALARLIAEEALDPLPALDGWLTRPPAADPGPPTEELPDAIAPSPPSAPLPVRHPPPAAGDHATGLTALIALIVLVLVAAYFLP